MNFEDLLITIPYYALELGTYVKDCLWSAILLALNRRLLAEHANLRRELVGYADCIFDMAIRADELWEEQVQVTERYLLQPLDIGLTGFRDERIPVFFLPPPQNFAPQWLPPPGGVYPLLRPDDDGLALTDETSESSEGAGAGLSPIGSYSP